MLLINRISLLLSIKNDLFFLIFISINFFSSFAYTFTLFDCSKDVVILIMIIFSIFDESHVDLNLTHDNQ